MSEQGIEAKAFVAMRAWKPFASEAARAVAAWQPEQIVLLPLYPQFSTTTTGSSVENWRKEAKRMDLKAPQTRVCCYPDEPGFVASVTALISETFARRRPGVDYRLLLSAHGLPKRTISKGDPYQWQVEKTAAAVVDALGIPDLDWRLCYQSRVGPLRWIGPATDAEIRCAGSEGKGIVLAPVAFVSEHSETLVELDIEYAKLALESDVPHFLRVPTAGTHPTFIQGLTAMVVRALDGTPVVTCGAGRLCPQRAVRCGYEDIHA